MAAHDRTFHAESRMASRKWVATALGWTLDEFNRSLPDLQQHSGFPKEDPLLRGWIKADVDKWIASRSRLGQVGEREQKREVWNRDAI